MFGGLCFTLNGKMLAGTGKDRLMVRLSDDDLRQTLESGAADPMDFTGKPLRNFAYIREGHYESDEALLEWISKSADFVRRQPDKPVKRKPP
jgi:TfoX/Sxy family transcriptional regulator of competence genes